MYQYFEIPSLDTTVRKALLDGIITRILLESGIEPKEVVFTDPEFNTQYQAGATVGETDQIAFALPDRLYVEVEEERDEMERITRGAGLRMEMPFFFNPHDHITAAPVRTFYNVTISLKKRSRSRSTLLQEINRFNALIDQGRYSMMTEAEMYCIIPKMLLQLFYDAWTAAESRVKRHPTFLAYLKDYLHPSVIKVGNNAGGQQNLAWLYHETRIEVVYDAQPPTQTKDDNWWEMDFRITFRYQRPEQFVVSYPYIINQTPMPPKWFPQPEAPWLSDETGEWRSLYQIRQDLATYSNEYPPILRLPYLLSPKDQFEALRRPVDSEEIPIFGTSVAFGEDNMEMSDVLDTSTLPYAWAPEVKEYIDYCRKFDPTGMVCMFRFKVWQNGFLVEPKNYNWDGTWLQIKGKRDVTAQYYVTESILLDLTKLPYPGLDIINKFPGMKDAIVDWLFPYMGPPFGGPGGHWPYQPGENGWIRNPDGTWSGNDNGWWNELPYSKFPPHGGPHVNEDGSIGWELDPDHKGGSGIEDLIDKVAQGIRVRGLQLIIFNTTILTVKHDV